MHFRFSLYILSLSLFSTYVYINKDLQSRIRVQCIRLFICSFLIFHFCLNNNNVVVNKKILPVLEAPVSWRFKIVENLTAYEELKRQRGWKTKMQHSYEKWLLMRMLMGTTKIFRREIIIHMYRFEETQRVELSRGGYCAPCSSVRFISTKLWRLSPAYDSREYRFRAKRAAFN